MCKNTIIILESSRKCAKFLGAMSWS